MPDGYQLDQLWYTWSTSGLDAISAGHRVRAASEGLQDLQSLRYKSLSRYLSYHLSEEIKSSNVDTNTAPISLAFVNTSTERLLMRKVFTGNDAAGRKSAFFIHLIAGLPETFTAREAICLWDCPDLWCTSDATLPSHATSLPKIAYDSLLAYTQNEHIRKRFGFTLSLVNDELLALLKYILTRGLPEHIHAIGQPMLVASLIYGLTHALPMNMLPGLTFSTYELNLEQCDELFLGTTTLHELTNTAGLRLQTVPTGLPVERPSVPEEDIQQYTRYITHYLLQGDSETRQKVERIIPVIESQKGGLRELIELFKFRTNLSPLTPQQLSAILQYPHDNREDLLDIKRQNESAELLFRQADNWKRSWQQWFIQVLQDPAIKQGKTQAGTTQDAFVTFTHAITVQLLLKWENELKIYNGNDILLRHCCNLLEILILPIDSYNVWKLWLPKLNADPIHRNTLAGKPGWFHAWLLDRVATSNPLLDFQLVQPWLAITSWTQLGNLLEQPVNAPPEPWLYFAIDNLRKCTRNIPNEALRLIGKYEKLFRGWFVQQLRERNNEVVLAFFQDLATSRYTMRLQLLLFLMENAPDNYDLIRQLLACCAPGNPYALSPQERAQLLESRPPDFFSVYKAPILAEHINQYLLDLLPQQLSHEITFQTLETLQKSYPGPLATSWWIIAGFLRQKKLNDKLEEVAESIRTVITNVGSKTGQNMHLTFADVLIPGFVEKIERETELSFVLETFARYQLLTQNKWELLLLMATEAGKRYYTRETYYHLSIYLLYGIQEGDLKHKTQKQENINIYLHLLYARVENDVLKHIDNVFLSGFLPDPVKMRWNNWRKTEGANRSFWPGFNKSQPPKQTPLILGAVPPIGISQEQEQEYIVNNRQSWGNAVLAPQRELQPGDTLVTLSAYKESISFALYKTLAPALGQVAAFCMEIVFAHNAPEKYLPDTEYQKLQTICEDARKASIAISPTILNYLIDSLLIAREKEGALKRKREKYMKMYIEKFPLWAKSQQDQEKAWPVIPVENIRQGLTYVMQRFFFFQNLEEQGKNSQRWLEDARQKARISSIYLR
jgi:hypothetical protein